MHTLASRARDCEGKKNHSEFVCYWRKRIAVIMHKANAGVILKKLKRITGGRGDGVMGEDLDVQCSVHQLVNYIQFSCSLRC